MIALKYLPLPFNGINSNKMIGILRFFLASCVVAFHLTAQIPSLGVYAVNFFYVISGFLITLILNKTYKFNPVTFSINRFLRLYPTYIFFALLGLLIIYNLKGAIGFHESWTGHFIKYDKIANILIFPWAFISDSAAPFPFSTFTSNHFLYSDLNRFRLVTSSWSVGVELVCYFVLWAFTARNKKLALTSLLLAITYHFITVEKNVGNGMTYFPFMAAMLPFSIGSIGYFISDSKLLNISHTLAKTSNKLLIFIFLISVFIINWHISNKSNSDQMANIYYYLNDIIALLSVLVLFKAKSYSWLKKIDKWLGDLSYPIFLCHYFGGYFAWSVLGQPSHMRGWDIFFIGYPFTILLGLTSVILIDKRVSKVRDFIRPNQNIILEKDLDSNSKP